MYVMLQGFSCIGKVPETAVPMEDVRVIFPADFLSKSLFLYTQSRSRRTEIEETNECYNIWSYVVCVPRVEGYPNRLPLYESSWVDVHPVDKPSVRVLVRFKGHPFAVEGHLGYATIGLRNGDQMEAASVDGVREICFWVLIIGIEKVFPASAETCHNNLPLHTHSNNNNSKCWSLAL